MSTTPTVYVVDDDAQFRESLSLMASSVGLNVQAYCSAEDFLDGYTDAPGPPRCMILDIQLPGLSGLGLQEMLANSGKRMPIIMISDFPDVSMAVQAMKAGAFDFLEKPLSRQVLLERIHEALDRDALQRREEARRVQLSGLIATLSQREHQVMDLLVAGRHAKQIAAEFGIGEKTVAKHRSRVLEKMQVDGIAELVQLVVNSTCLLRSSAMCGCPMPCSSVNPLEQ